MSNTFGQLFKITTYGESHGKAIGCIVDGCPSGVKIEKDKVQEFLEKRRPSQSDFVSSRKEDDIVEISSGIENSHSLGSPIHLQILNKNHKPNDYKDIAMLYRPGHADATYDQKYGIQAASGGGRSSARETAARVAAGAIAKCFVTQKYKSLKVQAWVERVYDISANFMGTPSESDVYADPLRCPDSKASKKMQALINEVKREGDTVGGVIKCAITKIPPCLGEPIFNKFEAILAHAMMSLPASKSFEIGGGLSQTFLKGSESNDPILKKMPSGLKTKSNHAGGTLGGITNGMPVFFTVGFKPVSSIFKSQRTVDRKGQRQEIQLKKGRHDPCVLPRAVPIVEAMTWLILADFILLHRGSSL